MASLRRDIANSTAYAEVIATLVEKGGTYQDLVEASGMRYSTVRKLVNALHRRKIVRVASWKRGACIRIRLPVWAFGSAPDAARPPRMPDAERKDRYEAVGVQEAPREAAKAALWAFQCHVEMTWPTDRSTAAIANLRAALAQQEEPCPNCASLEAQNTELDRKLAELEQEGA